MFSIPLIKTVLIEISIHTLIITYFPQKKLFTKKMIAH